MTEKQYDDILKAGLILFKEKQLQSIPSEKEIDYEFSRKFKKKTEKLIRNYENSLWLSMQKTGRRVAVFIIALILSFTASLSIKAIREAVFDFFFRVFSDHTELTYAGGKEGMTEYYILPLPEGYSEMKEFTVIDEASAYFIYTNKIGLRIHFDQTKSSANYLFDSQDAEVREIEVNGINVLYCNNQSDIFCYWTENGIQFSLIYSNALGEEYIHKVAGKLEETAPVPLS